jgi:hypothetical protein
MLDDCVRWGGVICYGIRKITCLTVSFFFMLVAPVSSVVLIAPASIVIFAIVAADVVVFAASE